MTLMRKSRIITLVFTVTWILMSLSFSFGAECLCCNHSESKSECCEKTYAEECCLDIKHLSKDCQCRCISCGNVNPDDLLPKKEYVNSLGKDQLSAFKQISSDSYISLIEHDIVCCHHTAFPLKYPSLFLINSSFLL
jgi:hypothetical protein